MKFMFGLQFIFLQINLLHTATESAKLDLFKNIDCLNSDTTKTLPIFEDRIYKNPYKTRFDDEKAISVPEIAFNGDYVRTIASYEPEDGTPVNLLPGTFVISQPVEQLVRDYDPNWSINRPVGYVSESAVSVEKAISDGGDLINYDNDYRLSLNKYYGSSTIDNRGSLLIGG